MTQAPEFPELSPGEDPTNSDWAQARQANKAYRESQAEATKKAEVLQRENAMLKAGVNPDDKRHEYFYKGYDGALEPDAIKSAAIEAGIMPAAGAQAPDPAQLTREQEQAAQTQRAEAAQGAIVAASEGAQLPEGLAGTSRLEEAFKTGGKESMLREAEAQGIPVVRTEEGQ